VAVTEGVQVSRSNGATSAGTKHGRDVLRDPHLNRGTAFTRDERAALGITGLLPPGVQSLEDQARRSYEQYSAQPTDLAKNDFLAALHDRNEVLHYKLLEDHLTEMPPVVYDPVVAQAIEQYSHQYQRPNGVYLSIDDIEGVEAAFQVPTGCMSGRHCVSSVS
jgi:malate dehydrogenase (oxaloacetate-decarboxylating)